LSISGSSQQQAEQAQSSLELAASTHRQASSRLIACTQQLRLQISENLAQQALEGNPNATMSRRILGIELQAQRLFSSQVAQAEEKLRAALDSISGLHARVHELTNAHDTAHGEKATLDAMMLDKDEAIKGKMRELEGVKKQLASTYASASSLREELRGVRDERDAAISSHNEVAALLAGAQAQCAVCSMASLPVHCSSLLSIIVGTWWLAPWVVSSICLCTRQIEVNLTESRKVLVLILVPTNNCVPTKAPGASLEASGIVASMCRQWTLQVPPKTKLYWQSTQHRLPRI
jgi:hypothetical protein